MELAFKQPRDHTSNMSLITIVFLTIAVYLIQVSHGLNDISYVKCLTPVT